MLRVCNHPMPHFNAMDSRGLPPNQGSAMDGWGTSDASENAEVQSGTVLKRPSHPAALGGIGLTGGGAPGAKPWMAATGARTGPNRSCTDVTQKGGLEGGGGCVHATAHSTWFRTHPARNNLLECVLSFTPRVLGIKLKLFFYFYFFKLDLFHFVCALPTHMYGHHMCAWYSWRSEER